MFIVGLSSAHNTELANIYQQAFDGINGGAESERFYREQGQFLINELEDDALGEFGLTSEERTRLIESFDDERARFDGYVDGVSKQQNELSNLGRNLDVVA